MVGGWVGGRVGEWPPWERAMSVSSSAGGGTLA